MDGVTAAAIGSIAGSVVVLARRALIDIPTIAIALVAAVPLLRFNKLHEPVVIVAAASAGLALYPILHG